MNSMRTPARTIDGMKRRAKAIGREKGVSHSDALDLSARESGYQNFKHARNTITVSKSEIRITAYWRGAADAGAKTAILNLPRTLSELGDIHTVKLADGFAQLNRRRSAGEHLEARYALMTEAAVDRLLGRAAHTLAFMALTGLQPSAAGGVRSAMDPDRSRISVWINSQGRCVQVTEQPTDRRSSSLKALQDWGKHVKFAIDAVDWPGMSDPGNVRVLFAAETASAADMDLAKQSLEIGFRRLPDDWFTTQIESPMPPETMTLPVVVGPAHKAAGG